MVYWNCIEGGDEGAAAETKPDPDAGEDGEGAAAKQKENLSDISEEEEIKIPPKDLSGTL